MKNGGKYEGEWKNGLRVYKINNNIGRLWKTYLAR